MTIAERLKSVRGKESRESFAQKIGVHAQTLYRYEQGGRDLDSGVITSICKGFDISPAWLLFGEGSMRPGEVAPEPQTPAEQPVIPTKTTEHCPRCERLEAELEREREERREKDKELRELSAELRVVSAENRDLWRKNGNLRVLCARFEEQQKSSPEEPIPDMAEAIRSSEVLARI